MDSRNHSDHQLENSSLNYYRPRHVVVFVVRINSDGKPQWLLMRRCGKYLNGNWQMVTGRIEANESTVSAAKRELAEETGLVADRFYNADFVEMFWEKSKDMIQFGPVFLAMVSNTAEVRLSPSEHDQFRWVGTEMALDMLDFRGQKQALNHIVAIFIDNTPPEFFLVNDQ